MTLTITLANGETMVRYEVIAVDEDEEFLRIVSEEGFEKLKFAEFIGFTVTRR